MDLKMKTKNRITVYSIICLLLIFLLSMPCFAEMENTDAQIKEMEEMINASSTYSSFQKSMLLKSTQHLINSGISFENTEEILKKSIEKSVNAYSIKKVLDVILETHAVGLPSEPLINKVNEGLAKNIDNTTIITVISNQAEQLQKADEILNQAGEEGLVINGGHELIKILADSLENGVPEKSLSWLVRAAAVEGKNTREIAEISEELSYLSLLAADLGLSSDEASLIFEKAVETDSSLNTICNHIQNDLESMISEAKAEKEEGKASAVSSSGSAPTSLTDISVEAGGSPTQETGEAPSAPSNEPEPAPSSPSEESPSPPEN